MIQGRHSESPRAFFDTEDDEMIIYEIRTKLDLAATVKGLYQSAELDAGLYFDKPSFVITAKNGSKIEILIGNDGELIIDDVRGDVRLASDVSIPIAEADHDGG